LRHIAVYPGTFDPMTNGHVDLVRRGCNIFDRVLVAVLTNTDKAPLFTAEERMGHIRAVFRSQPKVRVKAFSGLLVDFLRSEGSQVVVRGLRVVSDFEYEFQMALMNRHLDPGVETLFLTPKEELSYLSSRLVKEVHQLGGDVSGLVPPVVQRALKRKLPNGTAPVSSQRTRR
jgi:pantetheine-phosphate adenylyltransferase